ncbi:MAG: YcxB family protein [Chitinophagaceae bacterium]|nr:YcxB family protein [Chitinophagaceae bacterium]
MLHLKYHLTEEEYLDYNYYTAWAAPDRKQYRINYYLRVFILYVAVAGLYIFINRDHGFWIDLSVFGAVAIIYFSLVPMLIKRSIHKKARQMVAMPENKHILDECEVILMDTGITDKDKETESRYKWDAIVKKGETSYCYFLYTNSYHAIVIPKRTVTTADDKNELNRLLNTHLPLSSEFPG